MRNPYLALEMGNPRTGSKKKIAEADSELHAAARAGDLRAVESICSSNPLAVNSRDKHSRTPYPSRSPVLFIFFFSRAPDEYFVETCIFYRDLMCFIHLIFFRLFFLGFYAHQRYHGFCS